MIGKPPAEEAGAGPVELSRATAAAMAVSTRRRTTSERALGKGIRSRCDTGVRMLDAEGCRVVMSCRPSAARPR